MGLLKKNQIIVFSFLIVFILELFHKISQALHVVPVIPVSTLVAITLLTAVMYAAIAEGKRVAIISALIGIGYLFYFYSSPQQLFQYTPENFKRAAIAGSSLLLIGFVIGILRERTEQILERERQARLRAEIAEKEKDEFLGMVSHELKTPLTSLKAFVQLLELRFKKRGDKNTTEQLNKMDSQLNKLGLLIADIYDATKINTGKLHIKKESFHLNTLVEEAVEEVQQITKKQIIIKNSRGKKVIIGDKKRIGQVLTNLLTNAVRYAPSADKVIVGVDHNKKSARVSVQDFGEGIEKGNQKKIFEKFFQKSSPGSAGLGLGLYISSEIIKLHGGRIWVKSKKGKGSTFFFSLPLEA